MAEMSEQVKEEVERLRSFSDEELADFYVKNKVLAFPSTVVLKAIDVVMEERRFWVDVKMTYEIKRYK